MAPQDSENCGRNFAKLKQSDAEFAGNSLLRMVIIDWVINSLLGGLTLDPAGMHCPARDDAFVSSYCWRLFVGALPQGCSSTKNFWHDTNCSRAISVRERNPASITSNITIILTNRNKNAAYLVYRRHLAEVIQCFRSIQTSFHDEISTSEWSHASTLHDTCLVVLILLNYVFVHAHPKIRPKITIYALSTLYETG